MIADDVNTLRGRFLDTVGQANPDLVVLFDNFPNKTPPVNKVWCRFTVNPTSKVLVQAGLTKRYAQFGLATLQIIVPPQTGDTIGYMLADQMDIAFRDWRSADGTMTIERTDSQRWLPKASEPNFIIDFTIYWRSLKS